MKLSSRKTMDEEYNSASSLKSCADDETEKERRKFFADTAATQLAANNNCVLLWTKRNSNYITLNKRVVLRVRDASQFGFKTRFATRMQGALTLTDWRTALTRFQPNLLEIHGSGNPLPFLVYSLEAVGGEDATTAAFQFVRELALIKTDVLFVDVDQLLSCLNLLGALWLDRVCFSTQDFQALIAHLARLNLRALALSGGLPANFVNDAFASLQLEVVTFCTESGMRVSDLVNCTTTSPATRLLYLQEVSFEVDNTWKSEDVAARLLAVVPRLFPHLQTLIWDWTIVEPFNEHSEAIIYSLINLYKNLKMKVLAIPLYTPYKEVLENVDKICTIFEKHNVPYQNQRFCSTGVSKPNFTLLCVGEDDNGDEMGLKTRVRELFITRKCTRFEELCSLLYVVTGEACYRHVDESATLTLDFGGFDAPTIREKCLA